VPAEFEEAVRVVAIEHVRAEMERTGGFAHIDDLVIEFQGVRVPLLSNKRGIWRPRGFEAALSILTSRKSPYSDQVGPDGYGRYKWRGDDPLSWDNVALRAARDQRVPLIYFFGIAPNRFSAMAPVWLVEEEQAEQQFVVATDDVSRDQWRPDLIVASQFDPVRRYAERVVKQRLHQRLFRDRVLVAYGGQCSLCRLRRRPLLDAAHILSDREGGEPVVSNGLAMCAIHHRAFDSMVLTVRDDYTIEVRKDVLEEQDGPTLRYTLQGVHGKRITEPSRAVDKPNRELLEERYERFRTAS
jgi:putative restriction endonuclease